LDFLSLKNDVNAPVPSKSNKQKKFLKLVRSMTKIERSDSGSLSQRHGSADPDPHQNGMDPEHCKQYNIFNPNPAQHTVKDTLMGMLAKWRGRASMDWRR
jgi:hypothetical protein